MSNDSSAGQCDNSPGSIDRDLRIQIRKEIETLEQYRGGQRARGDVVISGVVILIREEALWNC